MHRIISTGVLLFYGLFAAAQSAQEIVSQHLADYGQDMWNEISSMEVQGFWVQESFQKHPIKITLKRPHQIRLEGKYQGDRFVQASNGEEAWQVVPWSAELKMTSMPAEDRMCLTSLYQIGSPLAQYADSLVLDGLESIDGDLLIQLRFENEKVTHVFYLGKDDFKLYLERIELKTGQMIVLNKRYEKYKNYHGLLAPTSVRINCGDIEREFTLDDITLGSGAPDSLFEWHKGQ